LIEKGVSFHALDITGSKWVEIDTKEDFDLAKKYAETVKRVRVLKSKKARLDLLTTLFVVKSSTSP